MGETRDDLREALAHLSDAEFKAFVRGAMLMQEMIASKFHSLHTDKFIIYMKEPPNSPVHYRGVKPESVAAEIRRFKISGVIPQLRRAKK